MTSLLFPNSSAYAVKGDHKGQVQEHEMNELQDAIQRTSAIIGNQNTYFAIFRVSSGAANNSLEHSLWLLRRNLSYAKHVL